MAKFVDVIKNALGGEDYITAKDSPYLNNEIKFEIDNGTYKAIIDFKESHNLGIKRLVITFYDGKFRLTGYRPYHESWTIEDRLLNINQRYLTVNINKLVGLNIPVVGEDNILESAKLRISANDEDNPVKETINLMGGESSIKAMRSVENAYFEDADEFIIKLTQGSDKITKHDIEKIILFNGNKIFHITLFVPCVITYINKDKKSKGIECIDKINKVESFLEAELIELWEQTSNYNVKTLVGASGSFESLGKMERNIFNLEKKAQYTLHHEIDYYHFEHIYQQIISATQQEIANFPGIPAFRVEMISMAVVMINYVLKRTQIHKIITSDYALKEGVMLRLMETYANNKERIENNPVKGS